MPLQSAAQKKRLQVHVFKKYKHERYKRWRCDYETIRDQKKRMALRLFRDVLHLVAWDRQLQRAVYSKIELISHLSCGHGEITERIRDLDMDNGVRPENELDYDSLFVELGQDPEFQHLFSP